jgi:hypothetical protein
MDHAESVRLFAPYPGGRKLPLIRIAEFCAANGGYSSKSGITAVNSHFSSRLETALLKFSAQPPP